MIITSDNECAQHGWVEAIVSTPLHDLHVSYPHGTDLDDRFSAFCHDEQEMITINGWHLDAVDVIDEGSDSP